MSEKKNTSASNSANLSISFQMQKTESTKVVYEFDFVVSISVIYYFCEQNIKDK